MSDDSWSRRRFLTTTGAAGLGLAGLSGTATAGGKGDGGKTAPSDFPRVTTRGHFDITWYGSVVLEDGYSATDYDTAGDFSGVFGRDELLVFAHGWLNDDQGGLDTAYTGVTNLGLEGYDYPGIGFSYDSDTWVTSWWAATEIAERNGRKLAAFTRDVRQQYPNTTVRYVAHSLGARVVLEAAKTLDAWGMRDALGSVSLLGGAADNDSVATDGEYGPAIERSVGSFSNFWKSDDSVLNGLYSTAEFDSAVGEEGCEGTPPANYEDVNVDYVPDHFSYYYEEEGCLADVVPRL
ncbi:alpha/beta hydrolase [Halomarina oriensis]|uniref:Alpha/beta hydrolase n=1 Tax=Halomarina oriensis TaxID=671145 RepID=A0A6B0GHB1_9EURY|nr:alpha/beta hydrolase [Halomarina oriensis]MWG34114.1 alpha/beta hydrolase [Halomarina oriensis]